ETLSHTSNLLLFFLLMLPPPPISTLFPYTTLFRSIVIAALLPEARRVIGQEFDALQPFGALPEIEMRHHQPHRTAMLLLQRLARSEEHTSELQSRFDLVCRLLLEKKKKLKKLCPTH